MPSILRFFRVFHYISRWRLLHFCSIVRLCGVKPSYPLCGSSCPHCMYVRLLCPPKQPEQPVLETAEAAVSSVDHQHPAERTSRRYSWSGPTDQWYDQEQCVYRWGTVLAPTAGAGTTPRLPASVWTQWQDWSIGILCQSCRLTACKPMTSFVSMHVHVYLTLCDYNNICNVGCNWVNISVT